MYTENELNDLLKQVEAHFTPFLAKAEADALLAKSEDSEKKPEDEKPEEAKPAAEEEKAEGEAEEADGKAKEADAEGEKAAEGQAPEAPEAEAPAQGADCDYDDEDHAHMAEMYGSMSPGELKAHHDAVRKALDAQGGAQGAPAEAPAEAAPAEAPEGMLKSEKTIEVPVEATVPAAEAEMLKSELAASKAELDELKKNAEVMKQFIGKLFDKKKAPAGKAITDLGVLEKSEAGKQEVALSKSEITKILTAKANNPTLAKSDRNAISSYYTGGQVNLDSIRHLLK